jgi:hypothetical protein
MAVIDQPKFGDVEVKARMKVSDRTSEFGVILRKHPSQNWWYSARIVPGAPDRLHLQKVHALGSSSGNVALGSNIVAGTWYWFRAQMRGQRVRCKFWEDGTPEPWGWTLRFYDTEPLDEGDVGTTGQVGIMGSNGAALQTISEVEINHWRAHGEITQLPPRWDLSRQDRWVPISARGMLRRLGQGRKALASAVRQHLTSYATYGWVPLEDNEGAERAGNLVPGGQAAFISGLTYSGPDTAKIPGIGGYVTLSEDTSLINVAIKPHASTGAQTMLFFMKMDQAPASDILLCSILTTGSTINQYKLYLQLDSVIRVDCLDRYNAVVQQDFTTLYGFGEYTYGSWLAITLYAFDSGGNINWALNYHKPGSSSGFFTTGTNVFAGSVGVFRQVVFRGSAAATAAGGLSVAHIFQHPGDLPFVSTNFARAAYAYIGELATNRFIRLTGALNVAGTTVGFTGTSTEMGAQLPATLVDLLEDCAQVEDGILLEERDDMAISLMTRSAMYNQMVVVLDIDAGHLSAPLDPTDDDQATRNDVTVSRPNGAFAVSVQETGPLNVNPPEDDPDGVGVYDESPEINLGSDDLLQPAANWRRSRGTLVDSRYPSMRADLTASTYRDDSAKASEVSSLDSGRMINLINPEVSPDASEQLVQSYREQLDQYEWEMTFVTTPGALHRVGVVSYTTRLDTDYLQVRTAFIAGTHTSMSTERSDVTKGLFVLPVDSPASFPFFIKAAGVVLEVTSVAGTSDPQTLTIVQTPTNGVIKTIPVGSPIKVVDPWRVAW